MSKIIRRIIKTSTAPKPASVYSQAVQAGNTLYLSGSVGFDKDTNKLVSGGTVAEARQSLINIGKILEASGSSFENVVKVTVLLNDINDFAAVNDVYKDFFKEPYPARTAYQAGKLPVGAKIEIEVIAVVGELTTAIVEN